MTPTSTYERIRTRAAEVCEERHLHPAEDPDAARRLIADLVKEHQTEAQAGRADSLKQPDQMVDRVWRALTEYGPLTGLFARHDVEEIFIEGDRVSYIEEGGRLVALNEPTTERENRQIVERLLEGTGRRLDVTSAIQQAHVLDGRARLTAVIEPVFAAPLGNASPVHGVRRNPGQPCPPRTVVPGRSRVPVVPGPGARVGPFRRTNRSGQDHRPRCVPARRSTRPVRPSG